MEKAAVPILEDLAFEVSFKEILGNLILCHEYLPEGKKLPCLPFSSFLTSAKLPSSENMLSLVKAHLDCFLVGTMSDRIREKYVKKFYDSFLDPDNQQNTIDIWVFLSAVLDSHFLKLKTHVAFPGSEPNSKLISIIAEHSPLLERLTLNFQLMKKNAEQLKPLMLPLNSLEHLTHLSLLSLDGQIRTKSLSLIGASCPKLTHLNVSGYRFGKKDVLAICFGEIIDELFPNGLEEPEWFKDKELERLEVSSERLTPLCRTLQELEFLWIEEDFEGDDVGIGKSVFAFALRHFPSLRKFKPGRMSIGVKILYEVEQLKLKTKFDKLCQIASDRLGNKPPQLKLNFVCNLKSDLPGSLILITKLDWVNVLDGVMLKAIGSFCPNLEHIKFHEEDSYFSSHPAHHWSHLEELSDKASNDELESILKGWKLKVDTVECDSLSPKRMKTILNFLGPSMNQLKLWSCKQFELENLSPCGRLALLILSQCSFNPSEPSSTIATSFLPNLRYLSCSTCLGPWSSLFENKPFRHLNVNCCHIGVSAVASGTETNDRPSKRFKPEEGLDAGFHAEEWSKFAELWGPQMRTLMISESTRLTMTGLSNLIPKLKKLKKVTLPRIVKPNESSKMLSNSVMEKLSAKMPSVEFTLSESSANVCIFLHPKNDSTN